MISQADKDLIIRACNPPPLVTYLKSKTTHDAHFPLCPSPLSSLHLVLSTLGKDRSSGSPSMCSTESCHKSNTHHKTKDRIEGGGGAFEKETKESIAGSDPTLQLQRQVQMCRVKTGFLDFSCTHSNPLVASKMKSLPLQSAVKSPYVQTVFFPIMAHPYGFFSHPGNWQKWKQRI